MCLFPVNKRVWARFSDWSMNEPSFSSLAFAHLSRLCETSLTGKYADVDGNVNAAHSIGLARSQEPFVLDDLAVSDHFLSSFSFHFSEHV